MPSCRRPFPSISINNQVIGDTGSVSLARIDLDYGPEFHGAICGQPNPVHLLFKQWQSIYWNVRADRNSNNCIYRVTYVYVRTRRVYVRRIVIVRGRKRRHFRYHNQGRVQYAAVLIKRPLFSLSLCRLTSRWTQAVRPGEPIFRTNRHHCVSYYVLM